MTTRRTLLAALGAGLIAPGAALAQSARTMSVIVLFAGDSEDDELGARPFFDEMRRLGWQEGVNIAYERVFGKGMRGYIDGLARSAANQAPDMIYAMSGSIALAVVKATETVPVVFTSASDPVAGGIVRSLLRPGGNATGAYQVTSEAVLGRFQLVREIYPGLKRIGIVYDREATNYRQQRDAHEGAARWVKLEASGADFSNYEAVLKILARFRKEGINVVAFAPSFTLLSRRRDVIAFAVRNGIALVGHRVEWAEAGALVSYGADIAEVLGRSAQIANRVLRGERPGEVPVERAAAMELAVNRRTAQALGVTLPQPILRRANRVID
jgi:putative ABC transport system substrate-binding protein